MQRKINPDAPCYAAVAAVFAPAEAKLKQALRLAEYDRADLVRRTTEDWRDYVAQLDRAAAHLDEEG